jgi:hypothetical protein
MASRPRLGIRPWCRSVAFFTLERDLVKYSEKLKDPRWQRKRLEVLSRDGWACMACADKTSTLQVHHKFYSGNPWDAPMDGLETLCEKCHEWRTLFNKSMMAMSTKNAVIADAQYIGNDDLERQVKSIWHDVRSFLDGYGRVDNLPQFMEFVGVIRRPDRIPYLIVFCDDISHVDGKDIDYAIHELCHSIHEHTWTYVFELRD